MKKIKQFFTYFIKPIILLACPVGVMFLIIFLSDLLPSTFEIYLESLMMIILSGFSILSLSCLIIYNLNPNLLFPFLIRSIIMISLLISLLLLAMMFFIYFVY